MVIIFFLPQHLALFHFPFEVSVMLLLCFCGWLSTLILSKVFAMAYKTTRSGTQLPLNLSAVPSVTHGASANWPPDYYCLSLWNHHPWQLCTCCFFSLDCFLLIYPCVSLSYLSIFAQMLPSQKVFPDHPSWNVSFCHPLSLYLDSFFP